MLVDIKKDTQIVLCDFGCAGWTTDDGFLMTLDHVSQEVKDLISMMLKVNPSNRLSAGAALREKWTKKTVSLSPKFREEVF